MAVIEEALRQLRESFVAAGRERIFDLLAPRLSGERDVVPAAEVARELGTTEGTVNVMVHRLRRRYRELLSAVVLRTVDNPTEVEEELRYLRGAARGREPRPPRKAALKRNALPNASRRAASWAGGETPLAPWNMPRALSRSRDPRHSPCGAGFQPAPSAVHGH
ncbi:MAG: hypothetical protein M5U12_12710 [Verrucomicrobia bacterium]|nr:hypothetical protein [Verrucomicrobiota bacterium]